MKSMPRNSRLVAALMAALAGPAAALSTDKDQPLDLFTRPIVVFFVALTIFSVWRILRSNLSRPLRPQASGAPKEATS